MSAPTPLDRAAAAMDAAPEAEAARLAFYDAVAGTELCLLLAAEAQGETAEPRVFPLSGGAAVLAFDREARLAAFAGGPAPYLALSGRRAVALLAGRGLALGVNLMGGGVPALLSAEAVDWLAQTLSRQPARAEARPAEIAPPQGLPDALLERLDAKLGTASGLARAAYLAAVRYDSGHRGHLLAFLDAAPGAEAALAEAVGEALIFSGLEAGELDVAFLAAHDPAAASLARAGLRIELPQPAAPEAAAPPGSEPDRPPRLR